jgi:hypothetical protein
MLVTRVMAGVIMRVRRSGGESKYQGDDYIFHFWTLQLKSQRRNPLTFARLRQAQTPSGTVDN